MAACQDESPVGAASLLALLGRHSPANCCFILIAVRSTKVDGYRALLAEANITASMSRTGNCYHNAVTESFSGLSRANVWNAFASRHEGRPDKPSCEYVECFYNRVRPFLSARLFTDNYCVSLKALGPPQKRVNLITPFFPTVEAPHLKG